MGNNKYILLIIGLIGGIFIGFVISRFTEPHIRPSDNLRMESSANHQIVDLLYAPTNYTV